MKESKMKDYKHSTVTVEDRIAELITIEQERGYLLDSEVKEYCDLRFKSKMKWKQYWR